MLPPQVSQVKAQMMQSLASLFKILAIEIVTSWRLHQLKLHLARVGEGDPKIQLDFRPPDAELLLRVARLEPGVQVVQRSKNRPGCRNVCTIKPNCPSLGSFKAWRPDKSMDFIEILLISNLLSYFEFFLIYNQYTTISR